MVRQRWEWRGGLAQRGLTKILPPKHVLHPRNDQKFKTARSLLRQLGERVQEMVPRGFLFCFVLFFASVDGE